MNIKPAIQHDWTFAEALEAAWKAYPGLGKGSKGYRTVYLEAWGNLVGRTKALAELQRAVGAFDNIDAACEGLGLTRYALRKLVSAYEHMPEPPEHAGLCMYFRAMSGFDRFLVEGMVYAVLGRDTNVRLVEFEEREGAVLLRFDGGPAGDLEQLADVLWERAWSQSQVLPTLPNTQLAELQEAMNSIRDRLTHLELFRPSSEVVEMLQDHAQAHVRQKDEALLKTWGQSLGEQLGHAAGRKLLGQLAPAAEDLLNRVKES